MKLVGYLYLNRIKLVSVVIVVTLLLISIGFENIGFSKTPSLPSEHDDILPLQDVSEANRQLLLSEITSLKKAIRPFDKKTFKRKEYRHNAWGWSYRARASLLAYRMFKDIEHVEAVLKDALYFANMSSWMTWNRESDLWFREVTTAGLISIPIIDLLLLANEDQAIHRIISEHYDLLLDAVIKGLAGFDHTYYVTEEGNGYYVTPNDTSKVEALNHMALYAVALARLYELTGEQNYRQKVAEMTRFWLASTTLHENNALSWPYAPSPNDMHKPAEYFWKASITIELPIAAYRIGAVIQQEHLEQIRRTLTHNLFSNMQWRDLVNKIDGRISLRSKIKLFLSEWTPWFQEQIARSQNFHTKKGAMVAMWHSLDCFITPIEGLDNNLFGLDDEFYNATSSSLYGVVFGLYARSSNCNQLNQR